MRYSDLLMSSSTAGRHRHDEDHFELRRGVSWAELQRTLKERDEYRPGRLAYLDGVLEVMSPGRTHEWISGVVGSLVEVWCLEHDIEFTTLGSWTLQDEAVARAVEPDECYVFGPSRDAARPDLAIEVIWTSGSIWKLEIYRKLGVREVWMWRRGKLTAHVLGEDESYRLVSASRVLPGIDVSQIAALVDQPTTSAAIRAYRELIRKR